MAANPNETAEGTCVVGIKSITTKTSESTIWRWFIYKREGTAFIFELFETVEAGVRCE